MRVPVELVNAFGKEFESWVSQFLVGEKLIESPEALHSDRFLSRSIVPHIEKLSRTFNRLENPKDTSGLDPYWKESSNPENLRLAYFLYFMPSNLFRVSSVIAELKRLGYQWPHSQNFKGIEWGAGPASGACGVAAGEVFSSIGISRSGNFALIEQDRAVLSMGEKWANSYFSNLGLDWSIRPFHRKVDWTKPLLPKTAPEFHFWLSSFFLNEATLTAEELSLRLLENWDQHLSDEGMVVLLEPALKIQSRRLLELRRALLERFQEKKWKNKYKVLLPCLGDQACGALSKSEDWCHEEVSWWRPPYFKKIDEMAKLDRKSLPFSYLVVSKTKRSIEELFPMLGTGKNYSRLVSPSHYEGKDREFFMCGDYGKLRARFRTEEEVERGSILLDAEFRGDQQSTRIDRVKSVIS